MNSIRSNDSCWELYNFNGIKSRCIASWIVFTVIFITADSLVHDHIHRNLMDDEDEERIWCIVRYTTRVEALNSIISAFQ
jgi:hypothetical protein